MFPVKRENEAFSRRAHAKRQRNVQTMHGWCTFTDGLTQVLIERYWLYASKLINKNYGCENVVWASSGMLRIEKPITFNKTCMWAFHTNSLLHGYVFHVCVHRDTMYTCILNSHDYVSTLLLQTIVVKCDYFDKNKYKNSHCCILSTDNYNIIFLR